MLGFDPCRQQAGAKIQNSRKDTAMEQKDTDLQKIKELIEIMKDNELVEIEIKHGDDKIFLKRSGPQQPTINRKGESVKSVDAAPPDVEREANKTRDTKHEIRDTMEDLVEIKSPLVGTFYVTPSPDSEHYVELGSHVSPQTVVCIIEAMKVMNEIKAETSGTIVEISVTNGQAVEYGQVIFRVKPD